MDEPYCRTQSCSSRLESAWEMAPRLTVKRICCVENSRVIRFDSVSSSLAISVRVHGLGVSSSTRRTERPEKTLVKAEEAVSRSCSVGRIPSRCNVNLPGTLIEIFPERSRKSMPCSMQ
jgi:hypothetical protein